MIRGKLEAMPKPMFQPTVATAQGGRSRGSMARALALVLAVSTWVPTVQQAHAAPAAGAGVAVLNKKAMEAYDAAEFEKARKSLLDAVALVRKTGLDQSPQAARTYINLGMVYIALKDKARGLQHFVKALEINPKAKLDPSLATPDMQAVWDAALAQVSGQPAPTPTPTPVTPDQQPVPSSPPPVDPGQSPSPTPTQDPGTSGENPMPLPTQPGLDPAQTTPKPPADNVDDLLDPVLKVDLKHNPVDESRGNQRVNIYVTPVPIHKGAVAKSVTLYFRGAGQERYSEVQMVPSRKQPGDLLAQIPAENVVGKSLQYYVQAVDHKNRVCGAQGASDNPMIIRIVGSAIAVAQSQDIEDPIQYVQQADAQRAAMLARDWVYFDVSIGTGGALVGSNATTEVAWYYNQQESMYRKAQASNGGFVWTGLGVRGEVGIFLWKGLSLGASVRFEPYLNHNVDSQENGFVMPACNNGLNPCYATTDKGRFGSMFLGKLRYQFRKEYGKHFRPYVHLDVGGGQWRGALNIEGLRPMTGNQVDPSSPYQPTDLCSAEFNGKQGSERMPAGCNSAGGTPGYNNQSRAMGVPVPTNLNRVCPVSGPCIDAILFGKILVGGGAGFYFGGRHVGMSLDFNILAAIGDQFGLFVDAYAGPQFNF